MKKSTRHSIAGLLIALFVSLNAVSHAKAALISASAVLRGHMGTTSESIPWRFNYPAGAILDTRHHRLFVKDENNWRVLVFGLDETNHIVSRKPLFVIGQKDISSSTMAAAGTSTLSNFTAGGVYDSVNDRLFISDAGNCRVLVYDVSPQNMKNGLEASYVIGQDNFTSTVPAISQNRFAHPDDIAIDEDNQRLFVSDEFGSRVLIFDIAPGKIRNGMNASHVLGQSSFTSHDPVTTADRLRAPTGVAYDPIYHRLFVSDYYDSRVLVFNAHPDIVNNGQEASYVLGQPDFSSATPAVDQNRMNSADDLAYDSENHRLFVHGFKNSPRVLIFDVSPDYIHNGQRAQNVLGQETFFSIEPGSSDRKFSTALGGPTYDSDNNRIFVTDSANDRVMEFSMIHILTNDLTSGMVGVPYLAHIQFEAAQGTSRTWKIQRGTLPDGLSLDPDTGIIHGVPHNAGVSSFTVEVDDNFTTGPFFDREYYEITINPFTLDPHSLPGSDTSQPVSTQSMAAAALEAFSNLILFWKR